MNASNISMNMTAKTEYSMSIGNESSMQLNQNVEFSQLDISEIDQNESKAQANGKATQSTSNKLSITLNTQEQHLLKIAHKENKPANSLTMTLPNASGNNGATHSFPEVSEHLEESALVEEDSAMVDDESAMIVEEQSTMAEQNSKLQEQSEVNEHTETIESFMTEETRTLCDNEAHFFQQPCVELGRRLWQSNALAQHYTKGCMWSPDGTCVLVPVHLDGMHVIELPTDLYDVDSIALERKVNELPSAVHVKEGGTVYDFAWYPFMNSTAPETCCWLASRQHEPIHMWDAFSGELRCTYRGYDDVDEVESAISIIFSNNGEQVIGGYKKSIKVFDTNIPGRNCNAIPVKQAISCFAINGSNDDTVTAGSWNGCIYHYDLRIPKLGTLFTLSGHTGGITWLSYVPATPDGYMLFSGARKDNKILQWDMRNYAQPVREFQRNVDTNQRIYFDMSPQCEWLVSGDTQGLLRIWDLCNEAENIELPLHHDCCNGVSFHPTRPILATSAGQYHFVNTNEEEELQTKSQVRTVTKEKLIDYENSLVLLWFGKSKNKDN